jgi:uncharacterized protein involved in exopolysaccharide biosynthesis
MEENQVRSIDPLKVFWSSKWKLLIFSMICTVTSYFVASYIPEVYESESSVLINPPKQDKSCDNLLNTTNIQGKRPYKEIQSISIGSYRDLVYTSGYLQNVIEQLKFKYPKIANNLHPNDLKNMISIKIPTVSSKAREIPSTVITFKVTGENPSMITEIANTITTLLAEESKKIRTEEIARLVKSNRAQYLSIKNLLVDKEHALEIFNRGTAVKTHKDNTSISEEKTNNFKHLKMEYISEEQLKYEILISKHSLKNLSERLAEIQTAESEQISDIRFLYKAIKPHSPISQNKLNIGLVSFVFSFTLAGAILFAKEYLEKLN